MGMFYSTAHTKVVVSGTNGLYVACGHLVLVEQVVVGPALSVLWVLGMTFTVNMGFPAMAIVVVLDVAVSAVRLVQLVFALQVVTVTFFPLALDVVGVRVLE
jgi:hypothetical protein